MQDKIEQLEWSGTLCDGRRVSYAEAEKAVAALGDEWRLPTVQEAVAANDYSKFPVIDQEGVKNGWHWTSTPCPWAPESAVFVVDSDGGVVNGSGRNIDCFVRAVRAVPGQQLGL